MTDDSKISATQQPLRLLRILRDHYRMHPGDKIALATLQKTWQLCRYPVDALRTELDLLAHRGWAEVLESRIALTESGAAVQWHQQSRLESMLRRFKLLP